MAQARNGLERLRARPEYEQFDRARDRAARQQDLAAALDRPQVSAFGRAGYGRPGLNFISDRFESYALGGVQLQWKAWTWGSSGREREALALQQSIVTAEETAFTDGLRRAIQQDLAARILGGRRRNQSANRKRRNTLATAALAYKTERLTAIQAKRHIINRPKVGAAKDEVQLRFLTSSSGTNVFAH